MAKTKVGNSDFLGDRAKKGRVRGKNRKFTNKHSSLARTSRSGNGKKIK